MFFHAGAAQQSTQPVTEILMKIAPKGMLLLYATIGLQPEQRMATWVHRGMKAAGAQCGDGRRFVIAAEACRAAYKCSVSWLQF